MTPIFVQRHSGEQAFERLYRSHVQDVYRYALMVLRNRDDAEDVAQTTFLKAYRAYQRGERPRHPRQWLITIAHNTCGTRIRDARRRPREVALEEQLIEPTPVGGGDVDVQELVRAVGALSFNQRAALVMRELEGRTYAEIAEVLEVSTSAVETLLFRARRALREQLEGTLTCGEAERVLSLELDGRLPKDERPKLRAHLRECAECASLARRQRARRAALRSLGPLPLPASLASWGGGAAVGGGVAVKVAALVAAGVAAVGATQQVGRRRHRVAEARAFAARRGRLGLEADGRARLGHRAPSVPRRRRCARPARRSIEPHTCRRRPLTRLSVTAEPAPAAARPPPLPSRRSRCPCSCPRCPCELPAVPPVEVHRSRCPSLPPLPVELPKVRSCRSCRSRCPSRTQVSARSGIQEGMTPLLAEQLRADRSFERIYRKHVGDVYRYALAVLRQPADAEDVAQTTFLNAYRAYQRGERPRNAQNWLIAIAHNVCRQRFRQAQRRPDEVEFDDRVGEIVPEEDRGPRAEDIQRALGHLAFNQRAALVMRELEGRSYAEIAEILETSVSAVETLLFRARRALREQLEGTLTCAEAERAISRQTDGRLARPERSALRAHLRQCKECERLARSQRAHKKAFKALALVPIPTSLTSLFGGGGAVVGGGVALKAAAFVAAGVVATGVGYEGARELSPPVASARGRRSRDDGAPSARGPDRRAGASSARREGSRAAAATEKKQKARELRAGLRKAKAVRPGRRRASPAGTGERQSDAAGSGEEGRARREAEAGRPARRKRPNPKPKQGGGGRP